MEWPDLLIIILFVGPLLAMLLALVWKIYRRGIRGVIEDDQQFLQRVRKAWKRRSERRGRR